MDWAEKYRPAHLADIIGNKTAVLQIAEWAKTWTVRSRPLIIYGKPGIGKTSTAYALATDMKWDVVELNASDQRTAAVIERIAGAGSVTASLTGSLRKLIVLDEADNLQGTADRGGAKAIIDCIRQARQPIILIANDLYGLSPELRARCEPVQFKAVPARSIAPRLKYLCSAEKIQCSETAIHAIAESAAGDIRSAVNMLYASVIGRDNITDAQVHTSQKDERVSVFSLITALFGKATDEELLRLSYEVDDTPETIEQWVEGNIQYLPGEPAIETAYRCLARADEYLGYTYRRQYHTLWRYATAIMLLGVAESAGGKGIHARIMPPERWQKMATARKQKSIRISTLNKVAGLTHLPQTTLRENYLGTIAVLVAHDPARYARSIPLDTDQLNFFLNDKVRTAEIQKTIAREEKDREKEAEAAKGKKVKKEKEKKPDDTHEESPVPPSLPAEAEPVEKKPPAKSQSTLFDGF